MAIINLNIDELPDKEEFEALPVGEYACVISATEVSETKAKTGYYIKVTFDVVEGEFQGQKIWGYLNIKNDNPIAEKIGKGQLKELAQAVGIMSGMIQDTDELHDIPVIVVLKNRKDGNGTEIQKFIAYKDRNGSEPMKAVQAEIPTVATPTAATATKKAWAPKAKPL